MMDLRHDVKVFVFQYCQEGLQYLLLKHPPLHEGFWGPVHGPIQLDESPEQAVMQRVFEETGLAHPLTLIDLKSPDRFQIGDFDCVEWLYGYQIESGQPPSLHLAPQLEGFRWEDFDHAYQSMEMEENRVAVIRLHTLLAS